ncbi:MAG: MerR family transcriptional regulator [Solirubrobacteraceae bacterium]|nr:MerR family transcriptional regulator [Patulibacter sp.]
MAELTIDQLASTSGLTARNIRSYQTRGLLPAPSLRGRVAYYGEEHLERLATIRQMQADGLSLKLVERFITDRAQAADQLLELRNRILQGIDAAGEETTTVEALVERFGDFNGEIIERAVTMGALVPRDDGLVGVPYPALLDIAERVVREGVSLYGALEIAATVQRSCAAVAKAAVEMVMEHVWRPYDEAGRPSDELDDVVATIDRLRPLATDVVNAMLPAMLTREIDREINAELAEQEHRP